MRIEESRNALRKMITNTTLTTVPVLVLANKQDVANAMAIEELRELLLVDEAVAAQFAERESAWRSASALEG